jgi:hypothetical protein
VQGQSGSLETGDNQMAIQSGLPVAHDAVFPNGAYMVGEVTPVEDFDAAKAARAAGRSADTQARDKNTGMRLWQVRVIDADQNSRKGQAEVTVKIPGDHQPMPPAAVPGLPFRPVEFDDLVATAYMDTSRERSRIAWAFRASGMHAPAGASKPARSSGEAKVA